MPEQKLMAGHFRLPLVHWCSVPSTELASSISGSGGSSSSSSSRSSSEKTDSLGRNASLQAKQSPLTWFTAPQHESGTQFGIYRAIVPSILPKSLAPPQAWSAELQHLQVIPNIPLNKKEREALGDTQPLPSTPFDQRTWAVFMIGGGHFAAAVLSLVPRISKQSGKHERNVEVLAHKTVHRYTSPFQALTGLHI